MAPKKSSLKPTKASKPPSVAKPNKITKSISSIRKSLKAKKNLRSEDSNGYAATPESPGPPSPRPGYGFYEAIIPVFQARDTLAEVIAKLEASGRFDEGGTFTWNEDLKVAHKALVRWGSWAGKC